MPDTRKAKISRKVRGEIAVRTGKSPDEIFEWLFTRWCFEEGMDEWQRQELGLQLLPYVKARKKAVEHSGSVETSFKVVIGGIDA